MNSNIIHFTGVRSPRYKAQRIRQDRDPDLFVDMLANHPAHIARAKAKYQAHMERVTQEAARERARQEDRERLLSIVGHVAVFALLALMVVVAL